MSLALYPSAPAFDLRAFDLLAPVAGAFDFATQFLSVAGRLDRESPDPEHWETAFNEAHPGRSGHTSKLT